jgi:anti-anti-sigma factor
MPSHPLLEIEPLGEDTRARLACRALDWETSRVVSGELTGLVRRVGRHNLRLDLGDVRFLTAAGLGTLVAARNELRARGGRLILSNVGPLPHEVFRVAQLDRLLDIRRASALSRRPDNRPPLAASDTGRPPELPRPSCWA